MSVCLRRSLHATLLFSSSSSSYTTATRTSTISPKRLGRVWSRRSLSHVSASATASTTTLRLFKHPTPPGIFFSFSFQSPNSISLAAAYLLICYVAFYMFGIVCIYSRI